ncbi:39 kDa FK506-binding nuclear protein-like [Teleopsis dalmanni]|uniref:39 kDa FK506-binding nuclear protein-like n=1 Tax=Teleopsis dalmanni TaxID=139649 RepID=UPI0018CD436A|nr:39 kDa FK506-binding nuclear protein-like [Teleopsis dalmanni]
MFWGLNLKPNRKYTQTTTKSFHISQAALDIESAQDDTNKIYIGSENQKFLICTLRKGKCEQVMLDLNFMEGDTICFQSVGSGNVSLAGYLIENTETDDDEDPDFDINDLREKLTKSAKKGKPVEGKADADSDEEESDDDNDEDGVSDGLGEEDDSEEEDDDEDDDEEDEDEEDEEDDDEDEEMEEQPKAKQPKLEKKVEKKPQQNGVAGKASKHEKKDKTKPKQQQQPQQKQKETGGERALTGGVKVQDLRVGAGAEAVRGKRANVLYEGRLKSDNRVFDSNKSGGGFKFNIGKGEVIKGWEVGVVGMKVGGKRRITCPPHMAYGSRGHPPTIPPNSTLVFEVELKGVN